MRATRRLAVTLAVCAATVGAGASCSSQGEPAGEPPEPRIDVVVGDTLRLTGPAAEPGRRAQKAAQLAVEVANDAIADTGADHALEIVHADLAPAGVLSAAGTLVNRGAGCVVGPQSRRGMEAIAASPAIAERALLIYPRAAAGLGADVVALPPVRPPRTLGSGAGEPSGSRSASFARLYTSTDPPLGTPRTVDARQFDSVLLCYLAAVAASSTKPRAMRKRFVPPFRGRPLDWTQLAEAVDALRAGRPIDYLGLTLRTGIRPSG